jgi:hypothetical protein
VNADGIPPIWVDPVEPESYPGFAERAVKPVTRADLDNQFHTTAMRYFRHDRPPNTEGYRLVGIGETLDLYTKEHDFGRVIWPMWQFLFAENWKEAIDEIAKRGLYLYDIWAYCPSGPFEKFEWSEYRVPDEKHRYIMEKLGPRFLGYDNGEQDGRYVGGYARRLCPAPATRMRAHEHFNRYFEQLGNDLQNYLIALCSLTFPHYFAQMGNHRMLGAETAQALPSIPMWYAFIRGAGKQYGILWYGNASVFNRWGWKDMADPTGPDRKEGHHMVGPTAGSSLSLLRRLWYVLVMYGSVMMSFETGHLFEPKVGKPVLTEIGREQLRLKKWCDDHPDRGELHTPVALLLDKDAGWVPPRHLYTRDTYLVWGNMPYGKGDHQIDLLFREIHPGYEDASFYHSERGFLTPTPCGDSFDVLLSDVTGSILSRYQSAVILGEVSLEGDLLETLRGFMARGGNLVVCANQLGEAGAGLLGLGLGKAREAYHAGIPGRRWPINEPPFRFTEIDPPRDAEVLSSTKEGYPLALSLEFGRGSALVFASEFFLSNELAPLESIRNDLDQPLPSHYSMLEHAKAILLPHLSSYSLVDVLGPPVQYLVNVAPRTDRLLVTLCNNSPRAWEGFIRPRRTGVRRAVNWMTGGELAPGRTVEVGVPPLDAVVVELLLEEPSFEVAQA